MKISVIMPSYLGEYEDAAKNREAKLIRAIDSFLAQDLPEKELIVVADDCQKTVEVLNKYIAHPHVFCYCRTGRKKTFEGIVRDMGLTAATGSIITYLDSDDYFMRSNHLSNIVANFQDNDWVYFDNYLLQNDAEGGKTYTFRPVTLCFGGIGTSNIAHLRPAETNNLRGLTWLGCDGYGHDWTFIQRLMFFSNNSCKLPPVGSYVVAHIPKIFDN